MRLASPQRHRHQRPWCRSRLDKFRKFDNVAANQRIALLGSRGDPSIKSSITYSQQEHERESSNTAAAVSRIEHDDGDTPLF